MYDWLVDNKLSIHFGEDQKQPPKVFCKKAVLRNFAKFAGKHLYQSLFFNKVAGLRPATLLKMRLWQRCCAVNFAKFLKTSFVIEQLRQLLLEDKTKCILSSRDKNLPEINITYDSKRN